MRRRLPSFRQARDVGQFLLGVVVILHELVLNTGDERPTILLIGASLIGVTIFTGSSKGENGNGNGR